MEAEVEVMEAEVEVMEAEVMMVVEAMEVGQENRPSTRKPDPHSLHLYTESKLSSCLCWMGKNQLGGL